MNCGRVVIPIEIRNKFDISEKDPLEIYVEGNSIILKKYEPNCIFCEKNKNLIMHNNKLVCEKCISKLNDIKNDKKSSNWTLFKSSFNYVYNEFYFQKVYSYCSYWNSVDKYYNNKL